MRRRPMGVTGTIASNTEPSAIAGISVKRAMHIRSPRQQHPVRRQPAQRQRPQSRHLRKRTLRCRAPLQMPARNYLGRNHAPPLKHPHLQRDSCTGTAAALAAPTGQLPAAAARTGQLPPPAVANAPSNNAQPSISTETAGDADMSQTTIASRWPDQLNAGASDDSAPAADNSSTNTQPDTASAPPPSRCRAGPTRDCGRAAPRRQTTRLDAGATDPYDRSAGAGWSGRRRDHAYSVVAKERKTSGTRSHRRPVWDREYGDRPLPYPAAAAHRPNIGRPRRTAYRRA